MSTFRDENECIGGGGAPARRTEQAETGRKTSGECPVCLQRLILDSDGLIPKHDRPDRTAA